MTVKTLAEVPDVVRISIARGVACSKMPFFTTGIYSLMPVACPDMPAPMGVTSDSRLLYNVSAMATMTPEQSGTVMLHEYMHIYLRHHERTMVLENLGLLLTPKARNNWGTACDYEINDNLEEAGLPLPNFTINGRVCEPCRAQNQNFPLHRTAEEYFSMLQERDRAEQEQQDEQDEQEEHEESSPSTGGNGSGGSQPSDDSSDQSDSPAPTNGQNSQESADDDTAENPLGWGRCGSGGGNPLPNEPAPTEEAPGRSPGEQEIQRKADAAAIVQYAGNVPSRIRQQAAQIDKPIPIPWTQKLSQAARRAKAFVEGVGRPTYARVNRWASIMRSFGSTAVLPGQRKPTANVALVFDTSGSMVGMYGQSIAQAQKILQMVKGGSILILACDAAVHTLMPIKNVSNIESLLVGGGGTDFCPAFEALEALPERSRPNIIVFATDGYGRYPESEPYYAKVIWLVTPGGKISVSWGESIDLEPSDASQTDADE